MTDKCFVCNKQLPVPVDGQGPLNTSWRYDCPRCGLVYISDTIAAISENPKFMNNRHLLSGALRWRKENEIRGYPLITTHNLDEILSSPLIPSKLIDKFDLLLLYLGRKTSEIGKEIHINPQLDYPITFSRTDKEFEEILKQLHEEQHYLESVGGPFKLTRRGLSAYSKLERSGIDSKQCFVAMNFDDNFDKAFEKMSEAINECGFKAYRTKGLAIEDVNDLIIAGIKESAFIVADFTGQKHGVYFEAGFARALGKKVIWTCREDEKDKLHFDTRQFNHILWKDEGDLKDKLLASIKANIT